MFVKILENSGLHVPNHLFLALASKHYNSVGQIQVTFTHSVQGRVKVQLRSSSPFLYIHGAFLFWGSSAGGTYVGQAIGAPRLWGHMSYEGTEQL